MSSFTDIRPNSSKNVPPMKKPNGRPLQNLVSFHTTLPLLMRSYIERSKFTGPEIIQAGIECLEKDHKGTIKRMEENIRKYQEELSNDKPTQAE